MPYKLRKAPKKDLYWVITTETGKKHSKEPIPLDKAKSQMRVLESALNGNVKNRSIDKNLQGGGEFKDTINGTFNSLITSRTFSPKQIYELEALRDRALDRNKKIGSRDESPLLYTPRWFEQEFRRPARSRNELKNSNLLVFQRQIERYLHHEFPTEPIQIRYMNLVDGRVPDTVMLLDELGTGTQMMDLNDEFRHGNYYTLSEYESLPVGSTVPTNRQPIRNRTNYISWFYQNDPIPPAVKPPHGLNLAKKYRFFHNIKKLIFGPKKSPFEQNVPASNVPASTTILNPHTNVSEQPRWIRRRNLRNPKETWFVRISNATGLPTGEAVYELPEGQTEEQNVVLMEDSP